MRPVPQIEIQSQKNASSDAGRRHIAVVLRLFSASGGLELYALKLVEALLAGGDRVTIICEVDDSGLSHPALTVHKIETFDKPKSKAARLAWYLKQTSDLVAQAGPFDIIHSQHFPVSPVDVVTFHNHTIMRLSKVGYGWEKLLNNAKVRLSKAYQARHVVDTQLAREAKMRLFVGAVMRDDFYQNCQVESSAPWAVAHPGASLSGEQILPPAGELSSRRPFTFLFVGKGFRKKGLDTLLKSCAILKSRGHLFCLQIAGIKPSPVRQAELTLAGLSGYVQYLGFRQDMEQVYAGADASVLPSKIEPFGMAPIQGMLFGLVPIVSRVCGVAEVLSDGDDALILQNHLDAAELATLMQKLILDRDLYNRLRERAIPSALRINWQQTLTATQAAYDRVKPPVK